MKKLRNLFVFFLVGTLAFALLGAACLGEDLESGEKAASGTDFAQGDPFLGDWVEPTAGRAQLTIEKNHEGYVIYIYWSNSAFENFEWHMTGVYDAEADAIVCRDCQCIDVLYDDDDVEHRNVLYTDGEASFAIVNGEIQWSDAQEDAGADIVFTKAHPWAWAE